MKEKKYFYVPELGSRSEKAEVVEITCKIGEYFEKDDELMVFTTDKAAFALEATEGGKIVDIKISVGDYVSAGDQLLEYE